MCSEDDYDNPIVEKLAHHGFAQTLESTKQKFFGVFLVNKPELFLSCTLDQSFTNQFSLDNKK